MKPAFKALAQMTVMISNFFTHVEVVASMNRALIRSVRVCVHVHFTSFCLPQTYSRNITDTFARK